MFDLGPMELGLILLIVAMLFGVGKLPEVFGSIGKGVREFRKEAGMDDGAGPAPLPGQPGQAVQPSQPAQSLAQPAAAPGVAYNPVDANLATVEPKG